MRKWKWKEIAISKLLFPSTLPFLEKWEKKGTAKLTKPWTS